MKKYDIKIIEYAPKDATIYELLRKEVRSTGNKIIDFITEGIFQFGTAVDQLKEGEAYYLIMNEQKAELALINREMEVSYEDVTNSVHSSSGKKHFQYNGHKYTLFRKVR